MEHFIIKCIVWKICLEMNHKAFIEYDIPGTGVLDIFDQDTGIIYEVEPVHNQKKIDKKWEKYGKNAIVTDIVLIPYRDIFRKLGRLPLTGGSLRILKEEIQKYVN